jgi:anti-sigma-K factor RskA
VSDEPTLDDQLNADVVERLLDELVRGDAPDTVAGAVAAGGAETGERREVLEILGLLGASVEPIAPPPAVRERLLAEVRAQAAATPAPETAAPATTAAAKAPAAPVVPMPNPALAAPAGGAVRRWALPLAASLALALAGVSGYQAAQLADQRATINALSRRLEDVESRTPTVAAVRGQLAEMRQRMALITGRGVEICALKPMAVEAAQADPNRADASWADSRGVLYVAADHQHWYLTVEGLTPCQQGRSYQLWFVPADGEPVSAGTFDVGDGVRVELSSDTMPHATRAVTITLEPAGGSPAPTGPAVLHGDEVMAVL